jgi:putative oxidoreductase
MASKGMTMLPIFYGAAVAIEILAGLFILLGYKTRWAAALLALYLIPVTFVFHYFWDLEGAARTLQMYMALKNLAIIGGLLFLLGSGPGKFAYDWWFQKHEPSS